MKEIMKKITMMLMLMMVFAVQAISAKSAKDLMKEYKEKDKASYTYVSPAMMMMAKLAITKANPTAAQAVDKVNCVYILNLGTCKNKIKNKFAKEVKKLDEEEYQPIVMQDGAKGKGYQAFVKSDVEAVKEVFLVINQEDQYMAILMVGHIGLDDIQEIMKASKPMLEQMK